ncbi:glycosyl hydrolase [Paenarthrobacter nicotinovorans]|uniref:glycosyl hydrolase n=1 Tax=Paenarthrobacter nicotinovorans TaxID=29320 RepID=UPI00374A65E0
MTDQNQTRHQDMRVTPLAPELFRTPPTNARPGMRWWWQSPVPVDELVRELRVIAEAGFGEVEIAFSPDFWADEAQRSAFSAVLKEARQLGVGVASTLGAAWPLQTPNTASGTEYAAQELQYGVTYIDGGTASRFPLPAAFDDPGRLRASRLLAVTAARVVELGEPPRVETTHGWTGQPQKAIINPERSTVLDATSLRDLTDEAVQDAIVWEGAEEGTWALFAFWMRDCEQGVTSFIDRSAAIAATEFLDKHQIGEENIALLAQAGTDLFEDSLELNADSLFWSSDFVSRFIARHGYDPIPYLPLFYAHGMCRYWVPAEEPTADFETEDRCGARVRADYYRLLTDLYVDDHLCVLQEWSERYGLRHKAQAAYGQNLEPVRSNRELVRAGGRAEGESLNSGDRVPVNHDHPTWRFGLDWQRALVGGAHQGGAKRISTELGAQFASGYALTLGDYKQMLDKEWAAGITQPIVHGFATQGTDAPWPTQHRFFDFISESWNDRHFPEWENWKALTDYWARGTVVLETGTPRTDVAVFRDGFLTTAARGLPHDDATAPPRLIPAEALERAGYSVQFIDPVGLSEADVIGADGTLFPDGPAYRALILDERAIPADAAEAIDRAARKGLPVVIVGEAPQTDSGFAAGDSGHARVRAAMESLCTHESTIRVDEFESAAAVLKGAGVSPRASWQGPALLTQWRDAGDHHYLVVYNPASEDVTADLTVHAYGRVRELDLWTGETFLVPSVSVDGEIKLPLVLSALALRMFEIAPDSTVDATPAQGHGDWRELVASDWTLEVVTEHPDGPRTILLDGQGPADWREVDELRTVSGVGRYATVVDGSDLDEFAVDLGELAGSAVVSVNGRVFGSAYVSGTHIHLGHALRGRSTLEIEVRTALRNTVVAIGGRPMLGDDTQAQGLIGPVRVLARRT